MQAEIAKAHAGTLRDWASQWRSEGTEGASEVAFLLERAARQIERTLGIIVDEPALAPSDGLIGVLRE